MSSTSPRRARLFLDANILVSAAWKSNSRLLRLWQLPGVERVASNYIVDECLRNLPLPAQQKRLDQLLLSVRVLNFRRPPSLQNAPPLAPKDQHVLAAAVLARAKILVTGDRAHFGAWYGKSILGVRIEPPSSIPEVLDEI